MTMFKDKKLYAELIGTFLLVFLSVTTHHVANPTGAAPLLTYIVGVLLLAHCIVGISGCHINPAVSIGATINKELTWKECLMYIGAQIVGALLAGLFFGVLAELVPSGGAEHGQVLLAAASGGGEGSMIPYMLLLEFGLVFVFVLLVLGAVGIFERTKLGGMIVGVTLVLEHLVALLVHVPDYHVSVNPAISIGSVLTEFGEIGGALKDVWLYIVPAVLAALAAGLVGRRLYAHLHHAKAGQFAGHNVDHVLEDDHGGDHNDHDDHHEEAQGGH